MEKLEESHEVAADEVKFSSRRKNPIRRRKEKKPKASSSAPKSVVIQEAGVEISTPKTVNRLKASYSRIPSADKGKGHVSLTDKYLLKEKPTPSKSPCESSSPSPPSSEAESAKSSDAESSNSQSGEEDNLEDDSRFMKVVSKKLQRKKSQPPGNHPTPHTRNR